jgi:hypothetical protein
MLGPAGAHALSNLPLADFTTDQVVHIIEGSLILIVLLVIGFWLVARLKRRMKDDADPGAAVPARGFTLADLRQMHKTGQLSDEEFTKAKQMVVEASQRAGEREAAAAAAASGAPPAKDSVEAIRARRKAREEQERRGHDGLPPAGPAGPPVE